MLQERCAWHARPKADGQACPGERSKTCKDEKIDRRRRFKLDEPVQGLEYICHNCRYGTVDGRALAICQGQRAVCTQQADRLAAAVQRQAQLAQLQAQVEEEKAFNASQRELQMLLTKEQDAFIYGGGFTDDGHGDDGVAMAGDRAHDTDNVVASLRAEVRMGDDARRRRSVEARQVLRDELAALEEQHKKLEQQHETLVEKHTTLEKRCAALQVSLLAKHEALQAFESRLAEVMSEGTTPEADQMQAEQMEDARCAHEEEMEAVRASLKASLGELEAEVAAGEHSKQELRIELRVVNKGYKKERRDAIEAREAVEEARQMIEQQRRKAASNIEMAQAPLLQRIAELETRNAKLERNARLNKEGPPRAPLAPLLPRPNVEAPQESLW